MQFEISPDDIKRAKHPHELFLFNLIFNHILVFVAILSASSLQHYVVVVPIFSVLVLTYTLFRAKRSLAIDPWFVKCHWQICARRSRGFIIMLAVLAAILLFLLWISGGDLKPQHYAVGGAALLPVMLTVLALVIMESDAMHQASHGKLSKSIFELYPEGALQPLTE